MSLDELDLLHLTVRKFTHPQLRVNAKVLGRHLEKVQDEKETLLEQLGVGKEELLSNAKFAALLLRHAPDAVLPVKAGKSGAIFAFAKSDPGLQELMRDPRLWLPVVARMKVKSTIEESRVIRLLQLHAATGGELAVPLVYYAAHTGRFGGSDKLNLQNLGRESPLRAAIEPLQPGQVVLAGDLSQIEARITATLAGQWDLVNAFAAGRDVYSDFASDHYGFKVNKEQYPKERFVGKTGILSLGFQAGWRKFFFTMNYVFGTAISEADAESVVNTYRTKYKSIVKLWYTMAQLITAMSKGNEVHFGPVRTTKDAIVLPNGMVLNYPQLHKQDSEFVYRDKHGAFTKLFGGKLAENLCQALARIVVTSAEVRLARAGLFAALSVHDELVFTVPERLAPAYKKIVEKELVRPVAWMPDLPVACEVKFGANYSACK